LQSYQTLGDLRLTFEHDGQAAAYRRELDGEASSPGDRPTRADPGMGEDRMLYRSDTPEYLLAAT
jgi:hypothetical protein